MTLLKIMIITLLKSLMMTLLKISLFQAPQAFSHDAALAAHAEAERQVFDLFHRVLNTKSIFSQIFNFYLILISGCCPGPSPPCQPWSGRGYRRGEIHLHYIVIVIPGFNLI